MNRWPLHPRFKIFIFTFRFGLNNTLLNKFFENLTPDSNVKVSYISDPNTKYSYTVKEDYSNSIKLELGFDLNLIDSWYFSTSIRRLIRNNQDFENEFAFKVSKPF